MYRKEILKKVKNRKEGLGAERTRRIEKQVGGTFHSLRVPPPVYMRATAAIEGSHFPSQVWLFITAMIH